MEPTKTILYARVSTKGQILGTGLQRQLEEAAAYCQRQGWPLTGQLTDEGRSAFHGKHRSIGNLGTFEQDALEGLEGGTRVVCENLDRLSRGEPEDSYDFVRSLTRKGVTIVTYCDGEQYTAKSDIVKILKQFLIYQRAHEESVTKSKRSKSNWNIKHQLAAESGQLPSKRTHPWLKVEGGKAVADDTRTPLLNRIFMWADAGDGSVAITRRLNQSEQPWNGKIWHRSWVIRLLSNRAVVGEALVNGDWVKLYPPIVPADVFERVSANAAARLEAHGGRKSTKVNNLLAGLCRCDTCNEPMTYVGTGYLRCSRANAGACSNKVSLAYAPFEAAVLDSCLHLALDDNAFTNRAEVARLNVTIAERQRDQSAAQEKAKTLWGFAAAQDTQIAAQMAQEEEERAKALQANLEALKAQREQAKGRASNLEHMRRVADMRSRLSSDVTLRKRVAQGFQSLITQVWFAEDGTVTLMLAGSLKALRIRHGEVLKQADVAEAFAAGNISKLHFAGKRDEQAAPAVLKRILAEKTRVRG